MGRFASNDFGHHAQRDTEWRFNYHASELLPFARKKYFFFKAEEERLRTAAAADLANLDKRVSQADGDKMKREIAFAGEQREKCSVWCHEFQRMPDRIYHLDMSDVTYFEIAPFDLEEAK